MAKRRALKENFTFSIRCWTKFGSRCRWSKRKAHNRAWATNNQILRRNSQANWTTNCTAISPVECMERWDSCLKRSWLKIFLVKIHFFFKTETNSRRTYVFMHWGDGPEWSSNPPKGRILTLSPFNFDIDIPFGPECSNFDIKYDKRYVAAFGIKMLYFFNFLLALHLQNFFTALCHLNYSIFCLGPGGRPVFPPVNKYESNKYIGHPTQANSRSAYTTSGCWIPTAPKTVPTPTNLGCNNRFVDEPPQTLPYHFDRSSLPLAEP